MMSNALLVLAGALPADAARTLWPGLLAAAPTAKPSLSIAAVGLVVLAVWTVIRIARPGKLSLLHSPGRPNRIDPAIFLFLLVAWFLLESAGALAAQWLLGHAPATTAPASQTATATDPRAVALGSLLARPLELILFLCVAARTFRHGIVRGMGLTLRRWVIDSARAVVGVLAVWPVCIGLFVVLNTLVPAWASQRHPLLDLTVGQSRAWWAMGFLSAVLITPLTEEILFRGMLQSMLRRVCASPWLAILISSVLFGIIHASSQPAAVGPLIILAAVLGYNYERTGRLLSPILLHAFFNAANLIHSAV